MARTRWEQLFALASEGPRGAAMVDGDVAYVAVDPVHTWRHADPRDALAMFAEHVDAHRHGGRWHGHVAWGGVAYDALRHDERDASRDRRPCADGAPMAWANVYGAALRIALRDDDDRVDVLGPDVRAGAALLARWRAGANASTFDPGALSGPFSSRIDATAHGVAVAVLREAIHAGDVYLVNLARIVHAPERASNAWIASRVAHSRARYASWFDLGDVTIGGMSMELGLAWDRTHDGLTSGPIKGTRPRGRTPDEDAALAAALAADPKERAENIMAVDVHRNDLGRVARVGSVRVPALCSVEPHTFVHHLVSTVTAVARAGVGTLEVLSSVLPLGSVTGAPKRSAMEKITQLEPERRGVYTGAYGRIDVNGSLTLAVAIRTLVADANGTHYGAGGGIVADSDPAREWQEVLWKEQGLRAP